MILVTGASGFIGYFVCDLLLKHNKNVIGIDNLNDYYDVKLKIERLNRLRKNDRFIFFQHDICDQEKMQKLFSDYSFTHVIHLAAQAGVRHSIHHPMNYVQSNLVGFCTVLECCRYSTSLENFIYASTSSVYGMSHDFPFHEALHNNTPMSLYAATKQANEACAQAYYHLYKLPTIGLRFFTVYGPWGRPDMALFKFTRAILNDEPIDIFNSGKMVRDWTYVEDVSCAVLSALDQKKTTDNHHKIYNIGKGSPESLEEAIECLERTLEKKAKRNYLPLQPGDVPKTQADIQLAQKELNYQPRTSLKDGIEKFVIWYKDFYRNQV